MTPAQLFLLSFFSFFLTIFMMFAIIPNVATINAYFYNVFFVTGSLPLASEIWTLPPHLSSQFYSCSWRCTSPIILLDLFTAIPAFFSNAEFLGPFPADNKEKLNKNELIAVFGSLYVQSTPFSFRRLFKGWSQGAQRLLQCYLVLYKETDLLETGVRDLTKIFEANAQKEFTGDIFSSWWNIKNVYLCFVYFFIEHK